MQGSAVRVACWLIPSQSVAGSSAAPSGLSAADRLSGRYTVSVSVRPLAILLTAIIAFHTLTGGSGGVAVLCFGGGHQHAPAESDHCASSCSHDASWPIPLPAGEHEHDCGCTDVEITTAELLTLPRSDGGSDSPPAIVSSPSWGVILAETGLGRRGPPMPPPWFDPGGVHRLAIVASVRLTI